MVPASLLIHCPSRKSPLKTVEVGVVKTVEVGVVKTVEVGVVVEACPRAGSGRSLYHLRAHPLRALPSLLYAEAEQWA